MPITKRFINKTDRKISDYIAKKSIKKKYKKLILATDHVCFKNKKRYWLKRGFSATDVMLYPLNSKNYSEYLNEFDRWKLRDINGDYRVLLDDKKLFHEFTKDFLVMPNLLGSIKEGKFYKNGKQCDFCELKFPVIFKPNDSGGGNGFKFINFQNGNFYLNNALIKEQELFTNKDNGIVERAVIQNDFFAKFYPNSVNTLRIVTINDSGKFSITNAVFRMGTSRSGLVDNASSGGIFSTIDLESGELNAAHSYFVPEKFECHPDTNVKIKGEIVPNFDVIKRFVIKNHAKMAFLKFIAWDIAVEKDGTLLCIEANASSDLSILQCDESQKNKPLGIFMEKNRVIFK